MMVSDKIVSEEIWKIWRYAKSIGNTEVICAMKLLADNIKQKQEEDSNQKL